MSLSALSACGTAPKKADPPPQADHAPAASAHVTDAPKRSPYAPAAEDPGKRGDYVAGGLYAPHIQDSAPDAIPDVDAIPEPEVKAEPRSRVGNRSYAVLGKRYQIRDSAEGYVEEGMASFYGKKFHGRLTSNQEVYDMYAFSAAHKSLPLPSYVRVTNLANGKSVIVRVNDRGPFHAGRVIDLSYAAATKLGFTKQGTARVEVRALTPGEGRGAGRSERTARARPQPPAEPPRATVADTSVSADEFERWMQTQGIRFAAGKPGEAKPIDARPDTPSMAASLPSQPVADAQQGDGVLLQLASFATRDNAERARDTLQAGGLEALRIDEASVNGQPVWRLRIGPVPASRAQELSARAADLGFGSAQIVRD
ncbi:MAG: septal ring lytic transglycosylase RlpA family protein [Lysobacter sp.]|nr:septal ring lytic transglycosylase RlpA family protein [Lysobacter sp.]